jgi:hypothetical protein
VSSRLKPQLPTHRHPEVAAERPSKDTTEALTEIGFTRFRIFKIQVGNSRLGWLASLAPQGDGNISATTEYIQSLPLSPSLRGLAVAGVPTSEAEPNMTRLVTKGGRHL